MGCNVLPPQASRQDTPRRPAAIGIGSAGAVRTCTLPGLCRRMGGAWRATDAASAPWLNPARTVPRRFAAEALFVLKQLKLTLSPAPRFRPVR